MDALDILLPVAAVIALSPLPLIAVLLVVGSPEARRAGPAFAAGAVLSLLVLCVLAALLVGQVGEIGPVGLLLLDLLRIVLGIALLWAAWYKWRTRPRAGEVPPVPKYLEALTTIRPAAAFSMGAIIVGLNFKHIGVVLAGFAALSDGGDYRGETLAAIAIVVVLSSLPILGITLWHAVGGERTTASLAALKQFMLANANLIVMVVLLLIGLSVLGSGISGLKG